MVLDFCAIAGRWPNLGCPRPQRPSEAQKLRLLHLSWSTNHYGENNCPLELLAGNHFCDRRYRLEGRERHRIVASSAANAKRHLILVVFQREPFVLCHKYCFGMPGVAQVHWQRYGTQETPNASVYRWGSTRVDFLHCGLRHQPLVVAST